MRRDRARPPLSARRILGTDAGTGRRRPPVSRSGGLVLLAMLILVAVVFAVMLRDGGVADNLGDALRHWATRGR